MRNNAELLKHGNIFYYDYVFKWQLELGRTDGEKPRPVCVLTVLKSANGLSHVGLLAVSATPPKADQVAIELPQIECRRAGLKEWKGGWVVVSEYNYDIVERSYSLDVNQDPIGRFSKQFMQRLADEALPLFRQGSARIDRTKA
ncbi:MAG: hypothetical protein EOS81_02915 [Mesorhizobium sp.]|uniref:hypothetical protein n=1 Tax=Mesorhizobium sp. TaxID=1871066 RepID=UPI000FE479CE|nr:MAG: hypothetical protein EOS81_02915 [Mesorhizobium sp.]